MAESIIVKYEADISSLKAQLTELKNQNTGLQKSSDDLSKKIETGAKKSADATSALGNQFNKLGGLIAAAFSIDAVIAFGNAAVNEFAKAEKAAKQLLGALNGNVEAQKRLLKQADEFQTQFAIDNDVIVAQQTFLAIQGRTETQINKTIKAAIQLSSVTGEDLASAVQKLDGTFEGNLGRLTRLDARFGQLTKQQLANGAAIDIINDKYAGFAEKGLEGVTGELQRIEVEASNAAERLGESIAPIKIFFQDAKKDILNFFATIVDGIKSFAGLSTANDEISKFKAEQLSLSLKAFEDFNSEKLKALLEADERELKSSKNLSDKQRAFIEAEIDALKQLIILREQDAEAAKKAAQKTPEELKKLSEEAAKAAKEAADLQRKIFEVARDEYEKIEKEKLDIQLKSFEVAREEFEKAEKEKQDIQKKSFEVAREEYEKLQEDNLKKQEEAEEQKRKNIQATFDLAIELADQIGSLLSAQDEAQIDAINQRRDTAIGAIDRQLSALEEANNKGKISDKQFEQQKKNLIAQRAAAEKKAADETKKLKQQEAEREKLLTVFKIGLILAEAIASVDVFKIIAATAQLAVAIATPIPQFAKGTKGKKESGVGLVGEQGAEFIYMPQGTQVVPADRTKRYKDAVNAMIDGQFEQYVYRSMIAPALKEATRKMEEKRTKSFAENIANVFNSNSDGTNPYRIHDGVRMNNKALAEAIGKAVAKYNYRDSNDRYYH